MTSYSGNTSKGEYIDTFLDKLFTSKTNGVYIELGANDGLIQSNTAFFEFHRGWTGVLIEPSIKAYTECVKNRPNSICVNAACVSNEYSEPFINGDFDGGLMSSVNGARTNRNQLNACKAITLEKILDEANISSIDLLSLDVEGYEYEVLRGLNLIKYRPRYMIIEIYVNDYETIVSFLKTNHYKKLGNITNFNLQDNPRWDGTHNDYLFVDSLQNKIEIDRTV
jgi:FkbM family methyltransferase